MNLFFLLFLVAPSGKADFSVVRVIWTSDLHGQLLPTADFAAAGLPRRRLGGWKGLVKLIQRQRTSATLLLDNGDFAFGSPEGERSQGRIMTGLFNKLSYDAVVFGARDYKDGLSNIELLARSANFPFLSDPMLNILLNRQSPLFRPYIVKEVKGVRVGIIGLVDPETPYLNPNRVAGMVVDGPIEQVRRVLPAVRNESAEVILVLGHIPSEQGQLIAESVPAVDLVICQGEPERVESQLSRAGKTRVVAGGVYGQRVGIADILVHKAERRVFAVEAQILNVVPDHESTGSEPPSLEGVVVDSLILSGFDTIVANLDEEFLPDNEGRLQLALVVAEGLRRETGADIAVVPLEVIEAGLTSGALTRRDLFNSVPYAERLRILSLPESLLTGVLVPDGALKDRPCPAVAGVDLFVIGDTGQWPILGNVARFRLRNRKSGYYKVVTTEGWIDRIGLRERGRLLPDNLTSFWLEYGQKEKTISSVATPRLYPATQGLVLQKREGLININTAEVELLCQLPGIGPKTAERIIEYRKSQGRFNSIEEIMNVRGIGPKRFEQIKGLITVR
ncbi:MAG: helix-hairpin-helix domain-containing protein [bacterium]